MKPFVSNTLNKEPDSASKLIILEATEIPSVSRDFRDADWQDQLFGVVLGVIALFVLSRLSRWQNRRMQRQHRSLS